MIAARGEIATSMEPQVPARSHEEGTETTAGPLRWASIGGVWGLNLDGSNPREWRPPRIDVFMVGPDQWAHAFARSDRQVSVRSGIHRTLHEAQRAAILDALTFFERRFEAALAAIAHEVPDET